MLLWYFLSIVRFQRAGFVPVSAVRIPVSSAAHKLAPTGHVESAYVACSKET